VVVPKSEPRFGSLRISATLLRIIVMELPASPAHVATDSKTVHYVDVACNPCLAPEALLTFLTRPCLRRYLPVITRPNMLDGLRQRFVDMVVDMAETDVDRFLSCTARSSTRPERRSTPLESSMENAYTARGAAPRSAHIHPSISAHPLFRHSMRPLSRDQIQRALAFLSDEREREHALNVLGERR
jgi:hypothetical protein